jgi:hypothetical protein
MYNTWDKERCQMNKLPIFVSPTPITDQLLEKLEQMGLVQRLHCTTRALKAYENEVVDDVIYASDPKWGPHSLLCVGLNKIRPELATHPDNEGFILFSDAGPTKPLYVLIALHKRDNLLKLVSSNALTSKDFILLEAVFNDSNMSIFSMLAATPHGEVTVPGDERPPCFFVTEPGNLISEPIELEKCEIILKID